ncbi:hypothetical protein QYF61_016020, partial [Mycteria americana]
MRIPEIEVSPEWSRGAGSPPSACWAHCFDAAQGMVGFLGRERTLSAHVQLFIHQYPQVFLCRAALNPFIPQSAKQPQVPQPLPISLVLQTLPQLRCPSLDMLQTPNVSLVVGGPKLNTAFEVRPHQCRVQGHDHCPSPAGHTIPGTSQDAIGFLGHLGTLLAHVQVAVDQHPQVLLWWAAFQPLFPKPVALHGVVVAQVQDPALSLVEPHTIGPSPWIQPVQVPLQSLPTLKQINTPTQLGVVCKLPEGALVPFVQITDKDVKQGWPQHRALGNTPCDRPPTGFNSIHHHSLGPAIQPVLYPAKSTPIQGMSSQFLQENAMGNGLLAHDHLQSESHIQRYSHCFLDLNALLLADDYTHASCDLENICRKLGLNNKNFEQQQQLTEGNPSFTFSQTLKSLVEEVLEPTRLPTNTTFRRILKGLRNYRHWGLTRTSNSSNGTAAAEGSANFRPQHYNQYRPQPASASRARCA